MDVRTVISGMAGFVMATTDDLKGGPRQYQGSERDRLVGKSESAILFERGRMG